MKSEENMRHAQQIFMVMVWLVLLMPVSAWAAHPLITDDAGTQGTGKYQLEASGTWLSDKENEHGAEVREINSFAAIGFTAGIAETLDVMVTVPYAWTETKESGTITKNNGLSDTVVEAKWRFYDKQKFSLAVKPGILLPTGDADKGLGTDHVGCSAVLISTFDAEPWSFNANLGYLYLPNSSGDRTNIWLASLAGRFAVAERWKIVGEIGAARNTDPTDSSDPVFAQIGLIYSPLENLDLSAGLLTGLNNAEVDETIRLGLTVRF
jgi:hypothetical protein